MGAALLAIYTLVLDYLGRLAVFVHALVWTIARLAEFCGDAEVFQVGELVLQVAFHLLEELSE